MGMQQRAFKNTKDIMQCNTGRGMIWKCHVLIFLSYTSYKLFYEANKQNEIIKLIYMEV